MKKITSTLLFLLFTLLLSLTVSAFSETDDGILYSVSENGVQIEGYRVTGYTLTVPSEIDGLPVTSVAPSAFFGNEYLTEIIFPDSVKEIGKGAMMNCQKLTSAVLPSGLESIPENCFRGCSYLEKVEMKEGLKRIEGGAFEGCVRLGETIAPSSLEYIADYAFSGCENLILTCAEGSYAEAFALSHGINTDRTQTTGYLFRQMAIALSVLLVLWLCGRIALRILKEKKQNRKNPENPKNI